MINYVSVNKLSRSQLKQVIVFFIKNFHGNKKKLKKHFSENLKNSEKQKWNLAFSKNTLCGAHLIKFKIMNFQGIKLKVCGNSYLAVDKRFQKFNVAKNLIIKLLKSSAKHDLILGFARKKMDRYWIPYGFLGITDFGVFSIDPLKINTNVLNSKVKINDFKLYDINNLKKIYKINDPFISGNLIRNNSDFKKYLINKPMIKIKIFRIKNHIIGYMILQNDEIIEIRIKPKHYFECSYSLKKYFLRKSFEIIKFNTNLNDPFLLYLARFSHEISTRYFYEGGHIIRIVDLEKFLNKLKPVIKKKLTNLGINKLSLNYEGLKITYSNKKVAYKFSKKININLVTKLIFGILPNNNHKLRTLFGNTHIQFPILDQF